MTTTGGPATAGATATPHDGHPHAYGGGTLPRPQHLGMAAGCTIAVGALALIGGGAVLLGALVVGSVFSIGAMWDPTGSAAVVGGALTTFFAVLGVIALVYGIFAVMAGVRVNRGDASGYSAAVVVNVLSLAFAIVSVFAAGLGLLHGALSGIALWALHQPDVKAYFGR